MPCHVVHERAASRPSVLTLRARPLRIALVGQPNVGKSVVFGRLTGRYVTVSNYPGTTVAVTKGRAPVGAEVCDIIDTPGVNSLDGHISEDERITRDVVAGSDTDLIIQVADARNVRRALMLTSQLAEFGKPMVLALNMIDEAHERGISIDAKTLAATLGIPVIEMIAVEGRGFSELRDALPRAARPRVPAHPHASERAVWAHQLTERVRCVSTLSLAYVQEALARATRRPVTGLPILAAVLYAFYLFVGVFGAQTLVKVLEDGVFGKGINPAAIWLADRFIPIPLVRDFLVGEYGLITMGVTYAIAIVLPVVATFFLMFGFLEDSGYIPRLAIFCDRIFRVMGLNGKAVLPMVLGLGCDTMATMTARIMETRKERVIVTLLLALGVPCSAQMAVILAMISHLSAAATAWFLLSVVAVLFLVGWLAAKVIPGRGSDFMLELPPLRVPQLSNIAVKTLARIEWYLREALPLFILGTLMLWGLDRIHGLAVLERAMAPLVVGVLDLPKEAATAFILGFLRRDYAAAGLFIHYQPFIDAGTLTREMQVEIVVALTTITLFIPCIANFFMILKERGWKTGVAIAGFILPFSVLVGGIVNVVMRRVWL
jgi:small GTP-binding protein